MLRSKELCFSLGLVQKYYLPQGYTVTSSHLISEINIKISHLTLT
jgi:hypothetical protein